MVLGNSTLFHLERTSLTCVSMCLNSELGRLLFIFSVIQSNCVILPKFKQFRLFNMLVIDMIGGSAGRAGTPYTKAVSSATDYLPVTFGVGPGPTAPSLCS